MDVEHFCFIFEIDAPEGHGIIYILWWNYDFTLYQEEKGSPDLRI